MRDVMIQANERSEGGNTLNSTERRSALVRIAVPDLKDQLRNALSGDSGRLQDVEILYDNSLNQEILHSSGTAIRSTKRPPASLRLGGLASLSSREKTKAALASSSLDPRLQLLPLISSKRRPQQSAEFLQGQRLKREGPEAQFKALTLRKST